MAMVRFAYKRRQKMGPDEIKKLTSSSNPIPPATHNLRAQRYSDLKRSIREYRLKYQDINNDYNSLHGKIQALLAVQLTIATFLFSTSNGFVPRDNHGAVFFWAGVAGFIASIVISLWSVKGDRWQSPPGRATLSHKTRQKFVGIDFLELIYDDYVAAYESCVRMVRSQSTRFDTSLLLFVISAMTLIVLKFIKN